MTFYHIAKQEPEFVDAVPPEELAGEFELLTDDEAEAAEPEERVELVPLWEGGLGEAAGFKPQKLFSDGLLIEETFKHYRQQGFPYRQLSVSECLMEIQRLHETDGLALITTPAGYQVADTFHRHRFCASANGMGSPLAAFNDDKKLRKAIALVLRHNGHTKLSPTGHISLVNGTQACSNFRPGFAAYLYRKFCKPGATVLDTSTGYGGRLIGAVASGVVERYIGIDPNTETYEANRRMVETLRLNTLSAFELYNLPAEDVPTDEVRGRCDFSFTSPPYFSKEIYSEAPTQSWRRYGEYGDWVAGFLEPMMRLTYEALKPGATAVINVAQTINIKGKIYQLGDSTVKAGVKAGFTLADTLYFPMTKRFSGQKQEAVATEPVFVFKKN